MHGERRIRITPPQLFAMISRLENWPRWTSLWMRADVVARRQNQSMVRLEGYVGGLPVESTVRATTKSPSRIEWRQAHGTLLDYAAGLDIVKDEDGCRVRYETALDSGIPFLDEPAVRQILVQEVERTLRRIKSSAEREITAEEIRLMKSRSHAAPASASATPNGATDTQGGALAAAVPATAPTLAPATAPEVGATDGSTDEPLAADDEELPASGAPADEGAATGTAAKKRRRRRRRRPRADVGSPAPTSPSP